MTEIAFEVEEDIFDGGWVAKALGFGITTQAESLDELKQMIRDALRCHFDDEEDVPAKVRVRLIRTSPPRIPPSPAPLSRSCENT